ncbi:MAG: A24 family peptidase [Planctomycetaceae bacterium]
MFGLSIGSTCLVIAVALFTAVAAGWDLRSRKIPNKLTLPMFAAGWVFQFADRGLAGLGDAALGFLLGFGILFVLWMVGGGGGGDVKLMGALSVWLGFRLTLLVMIASTGTVIILTMGVALWSILTRGVRASQKKYLATGKDDDTKKGQAKPKAETLAQRKERRVLPFAVPVALATWMILAWKMPTLDNPVRGVVAKTTATSTDTGANTTPSDN